MPYVSPHVLQIAKRKNIPIVHNQNGVSIRDGMGMVGKTEIKRWQIFTIADIILFKVNFHKVHRSNFLASQMVQNMLFITRWIRTYLFQEQPKISKKD